MTLDGMGNKKVVVHIFYLLHYININYAYEKTLKSFISSNPRLLRYFSWKVNWTRMSLMISMFQIKFESSF